MKDRAYEIEVNSQYDEYKRRLAGIVYKCFDNKTGSRANVNGVLAPEVPK